MPTDPYLNPNDPQNQAVTTFANNNVSYVPQASDHTRFSFAPSTGFTVPLTDTVSQDAINSNVTPNQVVNKANQFTQEQQTLTDITNTLNQVKSFLNGGMDMFSNPQGFLASSFNQPMSNAQTMQQQLLDSIASRTGDFGDNRVGRLDDIYADAGVNAASDRLGGIQNQIADRQVRQRQDVRNFEADAQNRGVARAGFQDNLNKLNVDANAELADLAIQEIAATGNYNRSLDVAKTRVQEDLDAFNYEIEAYKSQLEALKPTLDKENQQLVFQQQVALDQMKTQAAQKATDRVSIQEIAMEAIINGADASAAQVITNSANPEEALVNAVNWLGRLDRMEVYNSISKSNSGNYTGDLPNVGIQSLGAVSFRLPENQREDLYRQLQAAIASGNVESVDRILRSAAQEASGTTASNEVVGRDGAINALRNLKQSLETYYAAGGSTDILTGGYERVANKLGQTSDPNLAKIEIQIRSSIQAYRKAVSGAAFTEAETKEYERIWPQIGNENVLNTAILDQLISNFESNNASFYNNFYPSPISEIANTAVIQYLESLATPEQLESLNQ